MTNKNSSEIFCNFSSRLLQKAYKESKNTFLCPFSVMSAFAALCAGADGNTLKELENFLGDKYENICSSVSEKFNRGDALTGAVSIWAEERFNLKPEYTKLCRSLCKCESFCLPFDNDALNKINLWTKENTKGMIEKILTNISPDSMMYIINACAFDGKWKKPYEKENIKDGYFLNSDGEKENAKFLCGPCDKYSRGDYGEIIIKNYDGDYAFAAILPPENTKMSDFVSKLTGEKLLNIFKAASLTSARCEIPEFTASYESNLKEIILSCGVVDAFDGAKANFSKMTDENIRIDDIIHKTFISVDEKGTKAAATTAIEIMLCSMPYTVCIDRPFICAIIDKNDFEPIFIGCINSI